MVLLLVASPVARADEATEAARRYNADAEKAFNLGRFAEAIPHYEKAYKAKPVPEFLYNLGQCHRRVGGIAHLEKARFYFESYLHNAKRLQDPKAVEAIIAELDREIRSQSGGTGTHWKRPTGWIALGVGAASLATGIAFSVLAKQKADEFQLGVEQKKPFSDLDEIDRTGKQYQTIQIVTLVVGGVLAGAGGALLIWDRLGKSDESPEPSSARFVPWVTASGAGLSGVVRF